MLSLKSVLTSFVPPLHIAETISQKIKYSLTNEKVNTEHKNIERFSTNRRSTNVTLSIFNIVMCFIAFYFALSCGGNFSDFVSACCCSCLYVLYRLSVPCSTSNVKQSQVTPIA